MVQPVVRDVKAAEIAARLVSARLDMRALEAYPGIQPATLGQGYLIQEVAIHLWPDEIAGWKIGLVPLHLRERLGADRVAGPIWSRAVWKAEGVVEFPVFEGGFAAVEAEFVFRMGADAPAGKTDWTDHEQPRWSARCISASRPQAAPWPSSTRWVRRSWRSTSATMQG